MKKLFVALFILCISLPVFANESWEQVYPGDAKIGSSITYKRDYYELKVPSSLSGRSVRNYKNTFRADMSKLVRFIHEDGDMKLRGKSSYMNMDYNRDILDISIFKSKSSQSGASACIDCHGSNMPRTSATIGFEKIKNKTDPYKMDAVTVYLDKAEATMVRGNIDHWLNSNLMLRGSVKKGKIEQGNKELDASAFTIGLGGYIFGNVTWSGELNISKVEGYKEKKTIVGRLIYKIIKGLKISFEGGIFLDGYTQFGTEFAEIGMSLDQVKNDVNRLPSMFNKLKNDKYGYWSLGLEYEYKF